MTAGIPRKAGDTGQLRLSALDPRDYADDSRRTVDDRPYGGGPGMVMKAEPLSKAILAAREMEPQARVIYLSPQGSPLNQDRVRRLSYEDRPLILIAGRYEAIDERLIESEVDEEISIGDYILSGGELAAMVLIDALSRLIPGVLGHEDSAAQDSFSDGLLDCPHYTRPEIYNGQPVPNVLLSGDHKAIARWRRRQSLGRTWSRRPDLLPQELNEEDTRLLEEFRAAVKSD